MTGFRPSIGLAEPIAYINNASSAVPQWACLECTGMSDESATGSVAVGITQPTGMGTYFMLDSGTGAGTSAGANYGQAFRGVNSVQWAYFLGDPASLVPWQTTLGPEAGKWDVTIAGTAAYVYAGLADPDNDRIQVQALASGGGFPLVRFVIETADCAHSQAAAIIISVSCGAASPHIGDMITVHDDDGWFSGESNATLTQRTGWAQRVNISDGYLDCSYSIISISTASFSCG